MNRVVRAEELHPVSMAVAAFWFFGLLALGFASQNHRSEVARAARIAAEEATRIAAEEAARVAAAEAEAARRAAEAQAEAYRRAAEAREAARIAALRPRSDADAARVLSAVTVAQLRRCSNDAGGSWSVNVRVAQNGTVDSAEVTPNSPCLTRLVSSLVFREANGPSSHLYDYRVAALPTLRDWEPSAEDFE